MVNTRVGGYEFGFLGASFWVTAAYFIAVSNTAKLLAYEDHMVSNHLDLLGLPLAFGEIISI